MDAAADRFYREGFHGVGLDRILDDVGVTKTTFYNHFESKDDLIIAMLEKRDRIETEDLFESIRARAGDDPRARLLAVFDVLHDWLNQPDFRGCIFINAGVAFPLANDPIHRAAAGHGASMYRSLIELAKAADVDDPDLLTREVLLLLAGAITSRHVNDDRESARVARRALETLLSQKQTALRVP